jgi:iron complex outermembrane receptor protein
VQLSPHQIQAESSDFAKTDSPTGYFDVIAHLGTDTTLKNQTFADSMDHLKYSSYGFTARYKEFVFENRTTFDTAFRLNDTAKGKAVAGFAYRYTDGDEAEGRDILQVENRRDIYTGATPNTRFLPAYDGGFGYNWRQIGATNDVGAFGMGQLTFWDRAILTAAGREDRMQAHTYGTDFNGVYSRGDSSDDGFTYSLSAQYKITPGLVPYVTFARARFVDLGQGGMLAAPEIEGGSWMQPSSLDEAGVKYSGLGGKLYATLAVYRQKKTQYDSLTNTYDYYHAKGVESELRFAPDKHWAFTGTATWQRTEILSPPFFNSLPPAVIGFTDPSLAYGGNFNGVGSMLGLTGPLRVPRPARVFSLFGTYLAAQNFNVTFGGTYVPSYYAGYFQQVKLPAYVVCRAGLSYTFDQHWNASLQADNLFNKKYFLPQYLFQDVFISPGAGTTAELTLAYKW